VSKTISKIGGTCRNIQGPGGVVFGEFFLVFLSVFEWAET
jgi:hypothetical protein